MTTILTLCGAAEQATEDELLALLRQARDLYEAGLTAARAAPYGSARAVAEFEKWAGTAEAMAYDRMVELAAHRGVTLVREEL
ncbi:MULTISPECIES: hypothetical protein [Streptomyces]|uniref:hypothetical protein n=1 Tax=Streptomyces TaxID=1883 RepID=UPI00188A71E6|nr:hypothetical protein [Streptomyces albidoflavus]MBF4138233.1 hypothetical protein [Streptomyces albidoflavus]